jgi:hypothetical protein
MALNMFGEDLTTVMWMGTEISPRGLDLPIANDPGDYLETKDSGEWAFQVE